MSDNSAAKDDLIAIASYGDEHFGIAQSDRYREHLKKRFSIPAEQPQLYPDVDHIRSGYRRSVCGVHSIYYHVAENAAEIVRVLKHQSLGDAFWVLFGLSDSSGDRFRFTEVYPDCDIEAVSRYAKECSVYLIGHNETGGGPQLPTDRAN